MCLYGICYKAPSLQALSLHSRFSRLSTASHVSLHVWGRSLGSGPADESTCRRVRWQPLCADVHKQTGSPLWPTLHWPGSANVSCHSIPHVSREWWMQLHAPTVCREIPRMVEAAGFAFLAWVSERFSARQLWVCSPWKITGGPPAALLTTGPRCTSQWMPHTW